MVDAARRPVHASFLRQNRLPYRSGRPLKTLLGRSFVLGCACAVNRPLLELALPLPEVAASHDWWLALCAASAGQITCLDVPLLEYRRHAANASQAAFWNVLRGSPGGWRRRWEIGWKSFLRSLEQAKALRDRLHERNVAAGEQGELLDAFCRIVEQPNRWRRLWELHRLGVPAIDWPRRLLFDWCMLRLSPHRRQHALERERGLEAAVEFLGLLVQGGRGDPRLVPRADDDHVGGRGPERVRLRISAADGGQVVVGARVDVQIDDHDAVRREMLAEALVELDRLQAAAAGPWRRSPPKA